MRLAWWRETVDKIFSASPAPAHPVAWALERAIARRNLARERLEAMIESRIGALEAPQLETAAAIEWADAVGGSTALLVAQILDPACSASAVELAGRAWGLAVLRRSRAAAGPDLDRELSLSLDAARASVGRLSAAALPAALHVALIRCDLASHAPGELETRVRLLWAALRGRL